MEMFPSVVADIMSDLISVDGEVTVQDAAKIMLEHHIGSIIIKQKDECVGIVTKSDLLDRVIVACRDPKETKMREIMSAPIVSVHRNTPILDAVREMRRSKVSRLVVVDFSGPVGIVSESDIMRAVQVASLTSFSSLLSKR